MRVAPFLLAYLVPATVFLGLWLGGLWSLSTAVFIFVLTPVLDAMLGTEESNWPEGVNESGATRMGFNLLLWLWAPIQVAFLLWGFFVVVRGDVSLVGGIALTVNLGLAAGAGGITVAHELMHRSDRFSRALAELLMTLVSYPHFCIEHVLGHHRNVATLSDPATSRRGEGLYAFLLRTIVGSVVSSWRIETQRSLRKRFHRLDLRDRRLRYSLSLAVLYVLAWSFGGMVGVLYFAGQSLVAVVLLEAVNYLEHYGLLRARLDNGEYERVKPEHSWNSAHRLTSWYLFNLPRHADHHHIASRPYWRLQHIDASPQMPAGYATMLLASLVPPLWRSIMDPRVDRWSQLKGQAQ